MYTGRLRSHYAFNDPVFWNDPSGAGGDEKKKTSHERRDKDAIEISNYFASIDAFANAMYGIFSPIYNEMTYGSPSGVGGSAFVRYGPGDRGALLGLAAPIFKRLAGIQGMLRILNAAINRNETFSSTEYYWDWSMRSSVSMRDLKPWARPCLNCLPEFNSFYDAVVASKEAAIRTNLNTVVVKLGTRYVMLPQSASASFDRKGRLLGPAFANSDLTVKFSSIMWRADESGVKAKYLNVWYGIEAVIVGMSTSAYDLTTGIVNLVTKMRQQLFDGGIFSIQEMTNSNVYVVYSEPSTFTRYKVYSSGRMISRQIFFKGD